MELHTYTVQLEVTLYGVTPQDAANEVRYQLAKVESSNFRLTDVLWTKCDTCELGGACTQEHRPLSEVTS